MSKRRVFTGIPFQPMQKCLKCEHISQCQSNDNTFTESEILIDCEAFYYVFKYLENIEKRPILDGDIDEFTKAVQSYEEKHKAFPFLTPPLVANGTLAVELALKFLIFKGAGAFDCTHNLKELYGQLPEPHKSTLTNLICTQAHQNSQTLDSCLTNIANLFEEFRYFFEKHTLGFTGFLMEFIHIVCDYALSFKPEYQDKEDDFETEGDQ